MRIIVFVIMAFVAAQPALAQVYKCKLENGKTEYRDAPCEGRSVTNGVYANDTVSPEAFAQARRVSQMEKGMAYSLEARNRAGGVAVASTGGGAVSLDDRSGLSADEREKMRSRLQSCKDSLLTKKDPSRKCVDETQIANAPTMRDAERTQGRLQSCYDSLDPKERAKCQTSDLHKQQDAQRRADREERLSKMITNCSGNICYDGNGRARTNCRRVGQTMYCN